MNKIDQMQEMHYTGFQEVVSIIRAKRNDLMRVANKSLIETYWQVGKYISEKISSSAWGDGIVKKLAAYITHNAPDLKGFSDKNLWRMKQFYELYKDDEKLSTLWREIIGILLCADKDDDVVEYAMSRTMSPTLVARYELNLPDKKLLQQKMREIFLAQEGGQP